MLLTLCVCSVILCKMQISLGYKPIYSLRPRNYSPLLFLDTIYPDLSPLLEDEPDGRDGSHSQYAQHLRQACHVDPHPLEWCHVISPGLLQPQWPLEPLRILEHSSPLPLKGFAPALTSA